MGDKLFMIYITLIVQYKEYMIISYFCTPLGFIKMPFITASLFHEAGWVIMKHSCFSGLHNNSNLHHNARILVSYSY